MTLQLSCFALIALLAIARGRAAITRREARLTWAACVAGALSLTMYGFPLVAERIDQGIGGQNLLTLLRDTSVVIAVWCFRHALTADPRGSRRGVLRLSLVLVALVTLFLLIEHRAPTTRTLVLNRIDQPAAWLYGVTYMAAVLWILLDAARLLLRRGAGHRWMTITAIGGGITATGCAIELIVFTSAHFGWGGTAPARQLANAFTLPFFGGLATMLLGVTAITLIAPTRRRIVVARLQLLSHRRRLASVTMQAVLAPFASEKHAAGRTHHLLVVLGNAQRIGTFTPTQKEAALLARAQMILHTDHHFRPLVLRSRATAPRPLVATAAESERG